MNSYFFTVTFLMMMSFLTSSEMIRFAENSIENHCYTSSLTVRVAAEELRELTHLENLRGEYTNSTPKKDPKKPKDKLSKSKDYVPKARALGVEAARPPNSARLNFYTLLNKIPSKELPKRFSLYEVCARVMKSLYKDEPFFQEINNAECRILDKLIEKKAETLKFTIPDQLSTIDLEDEKLQKIFYHMLKGTNKVPSLLNYITFDDASSHEQKRKINLLFADPLIIHAIFPQGDVAEKLLLRREEVWDRITYQEENRLKGGPDKQMRRIEYTKELQSVLDNTLLESGIKPEKYKSHVFDCTLGKPGTVIFLEDPLTHRLIREKYIPKKQKNRKN